MSQLVLDGWAVVSALVQHHQPGFLVQPGEHAAGCWDRNGTIWVLNNDLGAKALAHELCHADGKEKCEEYDW